MGLDDQKPADVTGTAPKDNKSGQDVTEKPAAGPTRECVCGATYEVDGAPTGHCRAGRAYDELCERYLQLRDGHEHVSHKMGTLNLALEKQVDELKREKLALELQIVELKRLLNEK